MPPTDSSKARESWWVPKCAIRSALLCLGLGVPACLNPVPDEFPSNQGPVTVERESCEVNPYLAGCEPPPPSEAPNELDNGNDPELPGARPGEDIDPVPTEGDPTGADAGPPDAGPAPVRDADVGP